MRKYIYIYIINTNQIEFCQILHIESEFLLFFTILNYFPSQSNFPIIEMANQTEII